MLKTCLIPPACVAVRRGGSSTTPSERSASALWGGWKSVLTGESSSSVVLHSTTKHLRVLPRTPLRFMDRMGDWIPLHVAFCLERGVCGSAQDIEQPGMLNSQKFIGLARSLAVSAGVRPSCNVRDCNCIAQNFIIHLLYLNSCLTCTFHEADFPLPSDKAHGRGLWWGFRWFEFA